MQQAAGPQQQQQATDSRSASSKAQFYTQLVELPAVDQQGAQDSIQRPVEHAAAVQWQQPQLEQHHPALHQQQQQQQQQHGHSSGTSRQHIQPMANQQMPFAPVKFSSRVHLLDPNTGSITLPPKSGAADADTAPAAAGSSGARLQPHQRHKQQQQPGIQPMHPQAAAHTASSKRPIDRSNLGYKLLSRAGWQEGQGLGASEQGMAAPLAVSYHKGNTGLGFSKQQQPHQLPAPAAASAAGSSAASQTAAAAAAAAAATAGPVLGGKRVAALVAAELAAEDLDTKVKRHRQMQEQKAKEDRDKAIQTYLYRAFNDVEGPDSNPLLAKSHRLTATNPLLD